MKIEISPIHDIPAYDGMLNLRISTPDGNCHNFMVPPDASQGAGVYKYDYNYNGMLDLYNLLDKYINR